MFVLKPQFYACHTVEVAERLLGKLLVVRDARSGAETGARIVETEAYRAGDPASHSARGETPRSRIMFGPPGRAYVYFIYGMYAMLNFVTEAEGEPGAVLIRGVETVSGAERVAGRRKSSPAALAGPGRLTRGLGIRLSHNGLALQGPEIRVFDDGFKVKSESVRVSPRIGISKGRDRYWRFFLEGSPGVTRAPENRLARRQLERPEEAPSWR